MVNWTDTTLKPATVVAMARMDVAGFTRAWGALRAHWAAVLERDCEAITREQEASGIEWTIITG